jgi:GT2 family glycosyltransferase
MPKFSIIIPTVGPTPMFEKCVDSLFENSDDFELIVVNNDDIKICSDSYIVIENGKNLGFPIAVNQGIRAASGEIIVIMNNDVIVTPHWLDHLAAHMEYADMVGPVTNNISGLQKVFGLPSNLRPAIDLFAKQTYDKFQLQSNPWPRLVFFCVAIKREVIDKIGLLDEQFTPGNFEDDDFCLRAEVAGFKLVIAYDTFVYHYGSATHKALNLDYAALIKTNQAKFEAKWPIEQRQAIHKKYQ